MSNKIVTEFFDKSPPGAYDERNSRLSAISNNLHFLNGLILKGLPENARILCVGVGTGAEIFSLAHANPGWRFDGIDPSMSMLDDCRKRLEKEGILDHCSLFRGYLSEFRSSHQYDAVLCILVMHFVQDLGERQNMFKDMASRLKPGGVLINAEISYDMNDKKFPSILENWKRVQHLMGATKESLDNIQTMMKQNLLVLPPLRTEELIVKAGFPMAIQFFQSVLIHGWYAQKD